MPINSRDDEAQLTAFEVNQMAGYPGLFPLGFHVEELGHGIWSAYLHAQSVTEVTEIISLYAKERVCVFEAGAMCLDSEGGVVPLDQIARQCGLTPVAPDRDVIILNTCDLPVLLDGLPHYQLCLLDVEVGISEDIVLGYALEAMEFEMSRRANVLGWATDSNVYVSSHDNCYLYLESRHRLQLTDHLRCLLRNYVSARLKRPVALPPVGIVDEHLFTFSSLTILDERTTFLDGSLRLSCSTKRFSTQDDNSYPEQFAILVDPNTEKWVIEGVE